MKKVGLYIIVFLSVIAILLSLTNTKTNKISVASTNNTYTRKELQDLVVSTAVSYYYKNTYTDYEGHFRDNASSEFPTMYNVSSEMLSRSKYMTSQCEAFTVTCYMHSLGFNYSKYINSFYTNKYTSYVAKEGSNYKRYFSHDSKDYLKISNDYFSKTYSVTLLNNVAEDLAKGKFPNDSMLVLTYQQGKITKGISGVSDTSKSVTQLLNGSNGEAIINEIVSKLEPGDVILNNGHAMLWVGDVFETSGGIIHSTGNSFVLNSTKFNPGYDSYDVRYTSLSNLIETNIKKHGSNDNTVITILRPINSMCSFNSDGTCTLNSNYAKVASNAKARSKLKNIRVEQYVYDVTSDRTIAQDAYSVNIGDTISYNLSLTNKSKFSFCSSGKTTNKDKCLSSASEWKTSKNKQDFKDNLTITATIPKNTTFVSCNNQCKYENGVVTWKKVSSLSSNTKETIYTYQVRVNLDNSIKKIENNGMTLTYNSYDLKMGKITTNVNSSMNGEYSKKIRNIINNNINDKKTCSSSINYAFDVYNSLLSTSNMSFTNSSNSLKNIITADNIVNGIFNKNNIPDEWKLEGISSGATTRIKCSGSGSYNCNSYVSYTKKLSSEISSLTGNKKAINDMLVPGMYGGKLYEKLYISGKMSELDRIKYLWSTYRNLNVGDIVVTLKKSGNSFVINNAIIYDGLDDSNNRKTGYTYEPIFVYCKNKNIVKHIIDKNYNGTGETWYSNKYIIYEIYSSDLYVILRPSLYYKPMIERKVVLNSDFLSKDKCPSGFTFSSTDSKKECIKTVNYYHNATYKEYGYNSFPKLTRKGYTHNGWKIYSYNNNTKKYDISTMINEKTIYKNGYTIYPVWEANTYTISLDSKGGTLKTTKIYYKFKKGWYSTEKLDKSITSVDKPVKSGYDFKGFYTKENAGGTKVIDSTGKILITDDSIYENKTLYAYYTKKSEVTPPEEPPEEPVTPTKPTEPTEPEKPIEEPVIEEPSEPENPTTPTEPSKPSKEDPKKPSKEDNKPTDSKDSKTQ